MSEQLDKIRQLAEMPYSGIREEKERFVPKSRTLEVDSSPQLEKLEEEFTILQNYDAYEAQLDCLSKILKIKQNNPSALFNRGTILLRLGKYEEAIEAFDEKMLTVTTDADTYYNKAVAHYALDQWENTITNAKRAREIRPKLVDAWRIEGSALDDLERYEEAIECFDEAIKLNPNHVIAWRHKGITLNHGLKKFDESIACYEQVIRLDPEEKKVYLNMASVYEELNDFNTAISYYDKAIEKDPKWIAAIFDKGVTYDKDIGNREKALECFKQVIKINSNRKGDLYCKQYALMELKRYEEAIEVCEERLNLSINDVDKRSYLNRQAYAFNELKKYEEAIACCNKSLEIENDDWLSLLRKGYAYGRLEKHEEAIEHCDKILILWNRKQGNHEANDITDELKKFDPTTDEFENMGARIDNEIDIKATLKNKRWNLSVLNRHEDAIEVCEQLLNIEPEDEGVLLSFAFSLRVCNRFEEALACYKKIIKNHSKTSKSEILSRTWNDRGWVLTAMGREEESLECYEKAFEIWSKNTYALTNKGDVLRNLGKNEEALTCFDKAISINPNDSWTWSDKGNIEMKLGRLIEAGESFERALGIDGKNKLALVSKAGLYARLNKLEQAEDIIEEVFEIDSKFSNAWDAKARLNKRMEKFDEAIKCSDMAIKYAAEDQTLYHEPRIGLWLNNKADILMESVEKKTPQESVKILEKALEISNEAVSINPKRGIGHYTKGQILEKLGKDEEARESFEKAKELGYIEEED